MNNINKKFENIGLNDKQVEQVIKIIGSLEIDELREINQNVPHNAGYEGDYDNDDIHIFPSLEEEVEKLFYSCEYTKAKFLCDMRKKLGVSYPDCKIFLEKYFK